MKKYFFPLNFLTAIALLFSHTANATTHTANAIGNWTDPATWVGGIMPGATITNDTVVFTSMAYVALDIDVTFNGPQAVLFMDGGNLFNNAQDGSGNTYNTKLTMNGGKITGGAQVSIFELYEIDILGSTLIEMTQYGTLSAKKIRLNTVDQNLMCDIDARDSLFFTSGKFTLLQGSSVYVDPNAVVIMEGGAVVKNGGHSLPNIHTVWYRNINSYTTGMEISDFGPANIYLDLNDNNQVLTLGSDSKANNIYQMTGAIDLNGKQLKVNGDYNNTSTRAIRGSNTSSLILDLPSGTTGWTDELVFETGTEELLKLSVSVGGDSLVLGSDLTIYGELGMIYGDLMLGGNELAMGPNSLVTVSRGWIADGSGIFNGTNTYNVQYVGTTIPSHVEMTGSGLNDVTVNMELETDQLVLADDFTIPGKLDLQFGVLNLNGKILTLTGELNVEIAGLIHSNGNSILNVNLANTSDDVVHFTNDGSMMGELNIGLADEGILNIGSNLAVNELNFTGGSLLINNNMLIVLEVTGITGADADHYVMIDGAGKLKMTLPTAASYVTYPVGTPDNYTPALVQNNGAPVGIMVNVVPGVFVEGTTGNNIAGSKSVVNNTWNISSTNSIQEIELKLQWSSGMEMNGFDRTDARLSRYAFESWDHPTPTAATVVGTMYELYRPTVTSLGSFAIVDGESTLGTIENTALSATIYPNPADEVLNISTENGAEIELIDTYGKLISKARANGSGTIQMNIASLPSGIYYVKSNSSGSFVTQKLVKK